MAFEYSTEINAEHLLLLSMALPPLTENRGNTVRSNSSTNTLYCPMRGNDDVVVNSLQWERLLTLIPIKVLIWMLCFLRLFWADLLASHWASAAIHSIDLIMTAASYRSSFLTRYGPTVFVNCHPMSPHQIRSLIHCYLESLRYRIHNTEDVVLFEDIARIRVATMLSFLHLKKIAIG